MQLAVIVLVRNEADIFPAFAEHLAALFDVALFLDHGSTDGTTAQIEAVCQGRAAWTRWHVTVPGLHQSRFSTFALRHVFATTAVDTVVFLDADEFIDVPNRAALEAMLARPRDARCVPCLAWANAVPCPLTEAPLQIGDPLLVSGAASSFIKIIVPRALYDATGGRLIVQAGNHGADPGDGVALTAETIGTILHVPLRSIAQMTRKTMISALAHLARADRAAHEGVHRFDGLRRIVAGAYGEGDLIGWASSYGEPGAAGVTSSFDELRRRGFADRALDVAHARLACPAGVTRTTVQDLAAAILAWAPAASATMALVLDGAVLRAEAVAPLPADSALACALRERDEARAEAGALRRSASWRVMGPVRAMVRVGKRFFFEKKNQKTFSS